MQVVRLLVAAGADKDRPRILGRRLTPLAMAAGNGLLEIMQILLGETLRGVG
jgi:hypothetical protein